MLLKIFWSDHKYSDSRQKPIKIVIQQFIQQKSSSKPHKIFCLDCLKKINEQKLSFIFVIIKYFGSTFFKENRSKTI